MMKLKNKEERPDEQGKNWWLNRCERKTNWKTRGEWLETNTLATVTLGVWFSLLALMVLARAVPEPVRKKKIKKKYATKGETDHQVKSIKPESYTPFQLTVLCKTWEIFCFFNPCNHKKTPKILWPLALKQRFSTWFLSRGRYLTRRS